MVADSKPQRLARRKGACTATICSSLGFRAKRVPLRNEDFLGLRESLPDDVKTMAEKSLMTGANRLWIELTEDSAHLIRGDSAGLYQQPFGEIGAGACSRGKAIYAV